jgi:hypothetical protein
LLLAILKSFLVKNQKQNLLQLSQDFESPACSLRPSACESVLFIGTAQNSVTCTPQWIQKADTPASSA